MTDVRRLAATVIMGAFEGPTLPDWTAQLLRGGLGSICLFGSNVETPDQLAALTAAITALSPDVLIAIDEEGGDVTRLHMREGNPHPGNAALGSADDVTLTEQVAGLIGEELRRAGVNLDLAPDVDVNSNPHNPVIGVRSFGADPGLVSRHTRAYVTGLQAQGVGACVKHWPGHGDTATDSHLDMPTVDAPLQVLQERELAPFRAAVEAGTVAVMTSHVLLPAIDPALPATLSAPIVDLLRQHLGFEGLLVSDALDMKGASHGRGEPAAAVLAIAAGCDLLCLGADKQLPLHEEILDALVQAVHDGELSLRRLAEAAQRVRGVAAQLRTLRAAAVAPGRRDAGTMAATQAVRVRGTFAPMRGAVALKFVTDTNIAVGEVPWGLPSGCTALAGGGREVEVHAGTDLDALVAELDGSPVVALVREPHRRLWVAALLNGLAGRRSDLVVVEMGWPGPEPLPGAAVIEAFGASRANAAAVAEVLAAGAG